MMRCICPRYRGNRNVIMAEIVEVVDSSPMIETIIIEFFSAIDEPAMAKTKGNIKKKCNRKMCIVCV